MKGVPLRNSYGFLLELLFLLDAFLCDEVDVKWLLAVTLLMCHLIRYVLGTSID